MELTRSSVIVCERDGIPRSIGGARGAFSLHNHSSCSRETLDFLPGIARRIPLVAGLFEAGLARYFRENGRHLDFEAMHWRPPLTAREVLRSEADHLARRLSLPAAVAITDHDTFEAPRALAGTGDGVPWAMEWTVPFGDATFHLGVLNVPPAVADELAPQLASYTAGRGPLLRDLLARLAEDPETLIVLNHPLWDLTGLGGFRHQARLIAFLRSHATWIHALELNGYRQWSENLRVLPVAEGFGLPVVAAGDRHGCTPGTLTTVAPVTSVPEFARYVRGGGLTTCVVFPEYRDPFAARVLEGARDALGHHVTNPADARRWVDRVFFVEHGRERPLSDVWPHGGPWWLRGVVWTTRVMGSAPLRPVFRIALDADGRP